jgi:hypothetical protein
MRQKMDLFTPKFSEEQLHPYYIRLISEKKYEPVKSAIENWSIGMEGRKGEQDKFIKEFQTTFNSSLWELYLNQAFQEIGFKVDHSKETPDFCITSRTGKVVNVEAVTTNNPRNRDKSYYINDENNKFSSQSDEEFMNDSAIRLLGKIRDKRALFTGENGKKHPYSSLEHVKDKPFVIAVAPFDDHLSFSQNNVAINKVLFGIERPEKEVGGEFYSKKVSHIVNKNGAKLDVGIFTNDSYKEVSAIIFSTTGMFGKAVLQSNINGTVRATKYREFSIKKFLSDKRKNKLGFVSKRLSKTHTVESLRMQSGDIIAGSDMHFCHTSEWYESHLDGLHIYYNPYAAVKLDSSLFNSFQITQNGYDIKNGCSRQTHPDGSLVSRQVYTHE